MRKINEKNPKSVLITGASTGIGKACAVHLSSLGFRVFAGIRQQKDEQNLANESSKGLIPIHLDVTDTGSVNRVKELLHAELGDKGLDALINNAGIAVTGPIEFIPLEDLRRQFEVNVIGQVAITQACLGMIRRASGRIVNISSFSGQVALPFLGPYASSKFALEAISDALRVELRPWGIHVILIEPGRIATPIWEKSLAKADENMQSLPPQGKELYGSIIEYARQSMMKPSRTMLKVEAVAGVVEQALTVKKPKPRYAIGRKTSQRILLFKILPTGLRDKMMASRMGMK
jgi:NAD(P)-dependent dehydrogenase (short-subunit alcohol dehydrogenase family)